VFRYVMAVTGVDAAAAHNAARQMETNRQLTTSTAMTAIVRVAIIAVTAALFLGSVLNAVTLQRDLAVLFALATPLGISAWGFARGGHHEAALVLLCSVLTVVVTLVLVLNPRGAHDVAITAYGGVILTGALLLSRRSFVALLALTFVAGTVAFATDIFGWSDRRMGPPSEWSQYLQFIVIIAVFAWLGRFSAETLIGGLGTAQRDADHDPVTGLLNRGGFMAQGAMRMKLVTAGGASVLVLADVDEFQRMNTVVGYGAGDNVLRETARRLCDAAPGHIYGRIGDDEFAVLAHGLADDAECEGLARRIHSALQFEFSGVSVRSSVGFARSPRDANGLEALLLAAEGTLRQAKDHEHEPERFAAPANRI
jgi:diguanylate cyclase (GGDEF)-like protein